MVTTFALSRRALALIAAAILFVAALLPILTTSRVSAQQLTSRKVTINKSYINATDVEFAFAYTLKSAAEVEGIIYQFCTTPLGACTLPAGMSVQAAVHDSQTAFPANATAFTAHPVADEGDCDMTTTSSKMCFERTAATAAVADTAVTHTISGITAPSSIQTVYVRISLYSNNTFVSGDKTDDGTVATAFVQQLTTSGRVQERLAFCVAAIDDDDALPADCAAFPTTTSIDLGTIDNTTAPINMTSPVEPTATNGANDFYGIAMVNTNASGGVVIAYYPEADTVVANSDTDQLRNFRVANTDCSSTTTSVTDQCFINAAAGGELFASGTERFGLQIACKDTTQGTTNNLGTDSGTNTTVTGNGTAGTVNTAYANTDQDVVSSANCESPTAGDTGITFAWNNSSTAAALISSSSVVEDELVKLRFGAVAAATTPTGLYRVTTTYIATPTF